MDEIKQKNVNINGNKVTQQNKSNRQCFLLTNGIYKEQKCLQEVLKNASKSVKSQRNYYYYSK